MRQQGMLTVAAVLAGCGPSVSEPEILTEEVCGSDGPVQLLSVDTPSGRVGGASWGSAVVGERRVAAWFASAADYEDAFGAYLLDACGGNEIELGERDYPLVVGDAAFVCDPLTGEIRALDVDTAEKGPVLGSGYGCHVWLRRGPALMVPDLDRGRWGLLRPDGLRPVDVELDEELRVYGDSGAPYLPPAWGWHSTAFEDRERTYTGFFGGVILNLKSGDTRPLPEGVSHIFGMEDGRDMVFVYEPDASGVSQVARVDSFDADPVPAFTLEGIEAEVYGASWGTALLTRDEVVFFDPEQRYPRPPLVDSESPVYGLDETRIFQTSEAGVRGWDLAEGRLLVDFPTPGHVCASQVSEDGVLYLSIGEDDTCGPQELWAVPFDGTPARFLLDQDPQQLFLPLERGFGLLAPGHDKGPLAWVDRRTGQRDVEVEHVDGIAWLSHLPLPRTLPGVGGTVEYFVHEGEDAGLWLVGTPLH